MLIFNVLDFLFLVYLLLQGSKGNTFGNTLMVNAMHQLPNACYCSLLKVHPANWQSPKASLKKNWFIYYRFYDPLCKQDPLYQKGKLVKVKGMNHLKNLTERQVLTRQLLQEEEQRLKEKGFNPITGKYIDFRQDVFIEPTTPFVKALAEAEARIKVAKTTQSDFRVILNFVQVAARQLGFATLPIQNISRKHIKLLLAQIDTNQPHESNHRYNKVRSYLMILFNELVEEETIPSNPVREIKKKPAVQAVRQLLTPEERQQIDAFLKENYYRFWLFTHIFFHSGARIAEMIALKREDINLSAQTFTVTIKKGKQYKRIVKTIKTIALPYWQTALQNAQVGDYLFSIGLKPGTILINSNQITRRWNKHVKKKLGIQKDFYSLKHLNLDETASLLSLADASAMASHTSTAITQKHYTVGERKRQEQRLQSIQNHFCCG